MKENDNFGSKRISSSANFKSSLYALASPHVGMVANFKTNLTNHSSHHCLVKILIARDNGKESVEARIGVRVEPLKF